MAFPVELTSVLSGASVHQLQYWRSARHELLVPEIARSPRALYSFRDLVALRTVVKLRKTASLQGVRRALHNLRSMDLTDHPSRYQLVSHGKSIVLIDTADHDDPIAVDILKSPGDRVMARLDDIFREFEGPSGQRVANLVRPRPNLEVHEHRIGGWPTARDTRVPYDTIALLMEGGEVSAQDVALYYPTVTPAAALDAQDFANEVASARSGAA